MFQPGASESDRTLPPPEGRRTSSVHPVDGGHDGHGRAVWGPGGAGGSGRQSFPARGQGRAIYGDAPEAQPTLAGHEGQWAAIDYWGIKREVTPIVLESPDGSSTTIHPGHPAEGVPFTNPPQPITYLTVDYTIPGGNTEPAGSWNWYLTDHLGSTAMLTDSTGAVVAEYDYGDFGETTQTLGDPGLYNPYRYTGQQFDPEAGPGGLYFLRNRSYSPKIGRFLSRDPIGYGGGTNVYAYCGNDPVNRLDPSGLNPAILIWTPELITAGFAGAAYAIYVIQRQTGSWEPASDLFDLASNEDLPTTPDQECPTPGSEPESAPPAAAAMPAGGRWRFLVELTSHTAKNFNRLPPKWRTFVFNGERFVVSLQAGEKHLVVADKAGIEISGKVAGGEIRVMDGVIESSEASGHLRQNWTPQLRQDLLQHFSDHGLHLDHYTGLRYLCSPLKLRPN